MAEWVGTLITVAVNLAALAYTAGKLTGKLDALYDALIDNGRLVVPTKREMNQALAIRDRAIQETNKRIDKQDETNHEILERVIHI